MKNRITLLVVSFCCIVSFAEGVGQDSLLNLLKKAGNDTNKVNLLYHLSEVAADDDQVLSYAMQALQLAEKLNYKKGIADATNNIGYVYDNRDDLKRAMAHYRKSLDIRREINDQTGIAVSLNNIGSLYGKTGDNEKSMDYYLQSLKILEQTNDSFEIAFAMHNISAQYREFGNIPMAMEFEMKSLDIREKIRDYNGMADCYNNLGYICSQQSQVERAMTYYQKSLQIYEKNGNKRGIAMEYNNMGSIIGDHKKALEYLNKCLKLYEELGSKEGMGSALNNIGNIYWSMKNADMALQYYLRYLKIREESGSKDGIATAYINIGNVYEQRDSLNQAIDYYKKALEIKKEIKQKQGIAYSLNAIGHIYSRLKMYKLAETYCNESLKVSQELGYPVNISQASLSLSKIFSAQNRFKEAYEMHVLFKQMSDSISFSDARKAVAKMTLQFEFDKKEAVIKAEFDKKEALSKKEIEKQKLVRNYTAAGFSLVLISLGSFAVIIMQKRNARFLQTVSEVEMKALRSQMNPHFIFNSLNSINRYMNSHDTEMAGAYLQKFAKVMRLILENSQFHDVLLADDLRALELYMQLESMRMSNKFTHEIIVDESIDPQNTLIPPLILQPFVENSIWHGFSAKEGQGKITIRIQQKDHMLECMVEDNGIGRIKSAEVKPSQPDKKSLGMKITRSRIDIINKIKKSKAGVELIDLAEGMRVVVRLPLELDF